MAFDEVSLRWTAQLIVSPPNFTPDLPGDKITLPQSALEQLLAAAPLQDTASPGSARSLTTAFDPYNPYTFATESQARDRAVERQHQLPQPLTFRIVNPQNDRVVYAGIREFSSRENEIGLSYFLRCALGLDIPRSSSTGGAATSATSEQSSFATVTIHAQQLPKGTYVRLRPLAAGYDPEDWKALLERVLRDNYTTLTVGEVLIAVSGQGEPFRFLVDRVEPEGPGICVVDTDLEVDIVALTEDQAKETLQKRLEKSSRTLDNKTGTSSGGELHVSRSVTGQVAPGGYVDYELSSWDRGQILEICVEGVGNADIYVFASPFSARQRNRPRADEHVFGDFAVRRSRRLRIQPTNIELEGTDALYISVHALTSNVPPTEGSETPVPYKIQILDCSTIEEDRSISREDLSNREPADVQCNNCRQWVPQRTLVLHENFCLRNNVFCSQCQNVFQKRSPEWHDHWHCPHDSCYGNSLSEKQKHNEIFHTEHSCRACGYQAPSLPRLAQHQVLVSGLTPHELVDGGRTTECHLCNKIVRMRGMRTHLRHHDLERLSRPTPRICLNKNCGRIVDGRGTQSANHLGLCSICFGPLYVDTYDPEGKALRRRFERRYLSQMMSGCGKSWCQNEYCKTGKLARKPSEPCNLMQGDKPNHAPFYLCTDQVSQQRRALAESLAAASFAAEEKSWDLAWCVAAVEACAGDPERSREWLEKWAPARGEDSSTLA
ncbi:putative ubiquitin fusion degradation protein (Ufd1) [Aspergillus saccharolyticus JOP 1030-1]|uniref:Ubiquitin fusion degradation protein n=1 Tax=Aspergillus saccharolyticus JOP 1030-1 TaxID=1450539 RepID=A0A318ZI76_9EURO|nr:ubiquitin fusion degradation protein [Aspergillus saccharolyticus JOP 1030-1]PYH47256.1 ubiquitin fusion degradation protein [Aspergillus saccharolyticus JOP 1030-1]